MRIPDKVKIGGFNVEIKQIENLISDREHVGEYNPRTQIITIDKDTTKQQKEETFIHELLEAVTALYSIEMQHKDLSVLATVLHQIAIDNPGIFKEV